MLPKLPQRISTIENIRALKEWNVAIEALEAGETILLLRKGGIKEDSRRFEIEQSRVWLYPTYEHQKPELLKPEYANRVATVASGWHPDRVRIGSLAEIVEVLTTKTEKTVEALLPYHIWNERLAIDRLHWKPQQPLSLLLLRVYRLSQPQFILYSSSYGGCKSWIDLEVTMPKVSGYAPDDRDIIPVLDDREFADRVATIKEVAT